MKLDLSVATKESYTELLKSQVANNELPKSELSILHVSQEQVRFEVTGVKESVPELQKYTLHEWANAERYLLAFGYTINVLFDPRESKGVTSPNAIEADGITTRRGRRGE